MFYFRNLTVKKVMRLFLQWKLLKYLKRLNKRRKRRERLQKCEAGSDAAVRKPSLDIEVKCDWVEDEGGALPEDREGAEDGGDEHKERGEVARQNSFLEIIEKSSDQESRLLEGNASMVNICTQQPLIHNLVDMVSLSSSCLRTEASKHGMCINILKDQLIVMEELWNHYVHFHLCEIEIVNVDWVEQNKNPVFHEPKFLQTETEKNIRLLSEDISTSSLSENTPHVIKTSPTVAPLHLAQEHQNLFTVFPSVEEMAEQTPSPPTSCTKHKLDRQGVEVRKICKELFLVCIFLFLLA